MNQETANYIMQRMSKYLGNSQIIKLKDTLDESLRQSEDGFLEKSSQELLDMFIATKRLEDENYIFKSPLRRIHKIKTTITVRETYADEELEKLRDDCRELRNPYAGFSEVCEKKTVKI